MDYQEIITEYKAGGLDVSDLRKKLEKAKPLVGRSKFRAFRLLGERIYLNNCTTSSLITPETPEKLNEFEKDLEYQLNGYFSLIVQSIRDTKAWKFMGLIASEYSKENFQKLNNPEKFKMLIMLNKKYIEFLQYQKIADIRDSFLKTSNVDEEGTRKLAFLIKMFNTLKTDEAKKEFFCFDKEFLIALVDFRRSKSLRIEDFMRSKGKQMQSDYEKYSEYFSNEDFRDISENLVQIRKILKISIPKAIDYFNEISESEFELDYFRDEYKNLKKLEEKAKRMDIIRQKVNQEQEERAQNERLAKQEQEIKRLERERKEAEEQEERRKQEEARKKLEEEEKARKQKEKEELERALKQEEGLTKKMDEQIQVAQKTPTAKEQVNPLIFVWLEKEDTTLTRRVGNKNISRFFDKIKQIEEETGVRVSLFLVTNVGKEMALRRMQEFQKKANAKGFPRLVEGILGGYSSFKIDTNGKVTDIAVMSEENKEKIKRLLESSIYLQLDRRILESDEENFLRYQFSDKKDKSITMPYLYGLVKRILDDSRIKKQPLKFLPFIEERASGIDVVLESQLRGISQLPDYYKSKYEIAPGKTMQVNINTIEKFIGNIEPDEQMKNDEESKDLDE